MASLQDAQDEPLVQPGPAGASLLGSQSRRWATICAVPALLRGPGDRRLHQKGCRSLMSPVVLCVKHKPCLSEVVA